VQDTHGPIDDRWRASVAQLVRKAVALGEGLSAFAELAAKQAGVKCG